MTTAPSLKAAAGALALIAAAACATAACGREGLLERPGPMFGLPRTDLQDRGQGGGQGGDAPVATQNRTGDTTGAPPSTTAGDGTTRSRDRNGVHTNDPDDNAPTTARDLRDPAQRLTPLSAAPVPGVPDPLGPPVSTQPPG